MSNAETIPEKPSSESESNQKAAESPEIIRITLDQNQAAILAPMLDRHRAQTKITGLFCALTRSFRPAVGMVTLELQILDVGQGVIAALKKIARR
jgi:hypothetical protein